MYQYHKDGTQPARSEIFVFGSDLEGRHTKGAALHARNNFGAVMGQPEGLMGRCYALPTVSHNLKKMDLQDIQEWVRRFIVYAETHPNMRFFMTRVGCELAGYSNERIAPMFVGAPENINFPIDWKPYLEPQ